MIIVIVSDDRVETKEYFERSGRLCKLKYREESFFKVVSR